MEQPVLTGNEIPFSLARNSVTNYLHAAEFWTSNSPYFKQPEGSSSCSQVLATCP